MSRAAGRSRISRAHARRVTLEVVTFEARTTNGAGLQVRYGFHATPFGECVVATTAWGMCALFFVMKGERRKAVAALRGEWQHAIITPDPQATRSLLEQVFPRSPARRKPPITLFLRGTNFQLAVWKALLGIPTGCVESYAELARRVGRPKAARAVGGAVAKNPVAYLIPCHRVIHKDGRLGQYRWGPSRKQAMIRWEAMQGGDRQTSARR